MNNPTPKGKTMKYPVGTQYKTMGKYPILCTVVDYWVTRNLSGEVVRERYVSTHDFLGQPITDYDVPAVAIARGIQS